MECRYCHGPIEPPERAEIYDFCKQCSKEVTGTTYVFCSVTSHANGAHLESLESYYKR